MESFLRVAIFLLLATNLSYGQISLRVFNYRPTGEFGAVMKPLVSVEIGYQSSFSQGTNNRMRTGISLLYLNMKPRLEVFPVYGILQDSGVTTVLPGYQSFQKYALFQLIGGMDYAFIHKKKLNVYAGVDLVIGTASVEYTNLIIGLIDEGYQGGGLLSGFRFRLGVDYEITDDIGVFVNANRQGFLLIEPRALNGANDYGLGMRYTFN
ncbi:MAG: hypothetical protein NW218_07665 [Saprospiraceae bacterium]|nr:hypothetical protein [Saprospiraceae bacterium]